MTMIMYRPEINRPKQNKTKKTALGSDRDE